MSEGHASQSLLSDVRHVLALEYLSNLTIDLAEISYLLGYDDQGSFFRAFHK
jgi:AraC-like DNA-binding protein